MLKSFIDVNSQIFRHYMDYNGNGNLDPLEFGYQVSQLSFPVMIWGFLVGYCLIYLMGRRSGKPIIFFYYLTFLMGIFLVSTKLVNEPYPLWILPMILIISLVQNRYRILYALITCIPVVFLTLHTPASDFFKVYWDFSENIRNFLRLNELYVNGFLSFLSIVFFSVLCLLIYRIVDEIVISVD